MSNEMTPGILLNAARLRIADLEYREQVGAIAYHAAKARADHLTRLGNDLLSGLSAYLANQGPFPDRQIAVWREAVTKKNEGQGITPGPLETDITPRGATSHDSMASAPARINSIST